MVPVKCKHCGQQWTDDEIKVLRNSKVLTCPKCLRKITYQDAILDVALSGHTFLNYSFVSDMVEWGEIEVDPGRSYEIDLKKHFARVHLIHTNVVGDPSNPPVFFHTHALPINNMRFRLYTSKSLDHLLELQVGRVSWSAYGRGVGTTIPLWRELMSNAKRFQMEDENRAAIVEIESSFEVFVSEFLRSNLRLRAETVDWLLKRSIEEQLSKLMFEATGQTLQEINAGYYDRWIKEVKTLRDKIVHRGEKNISTAQVQSALEVVLRLITIIDPNSIQQIEL